MDSRPTDLLTISLVVIVLADKIYQFDTKIIGDAS